MDHMGGKGLATMLAAGALVLAGCGGGPDLHQIQGGATSDPVEVEGSPQPDVVTDSPDAELTSYVVEPPGPLESSLLRDDVLITSTRPLPKGMVRRIRAIDGVDGVLPISLASASIDGRTLRVAGVDLAEFRRYTPYETATADVVWDRLAGGEVAVDHGVSRKLIDDDDMMRLGTREDSPTVHVGVYAPLTEGIQAVVNEKRGAQIGLPDQNALLVSTGAKTPSVLRKQFERILGDSATMEILALEFDVGTTQTAVLTGSSVSRAIGSFSYTNRPNGEISPDPAWVSAYIRTEEVPILGRVTCNKAYLPQLRAALQEVVDSGLADKINPGEYAGCYYPRYIGRSASNGLSLHSWGIAVDINVPGNLRGTTGEIDRRVVAIFKKWGMAWGGDWRWTDPMHFEMNAVVRPG